MSSVGRLGVSDWKMFRRNCLELLLGIENERNKDNFDYVLSKMLFL